MNNCQKIKMMDCETLAFFLLENMVDYCCDNCPAYSNFCSNDPSYFSRPGDIICVEQMVKWLESDYK